MIGNRVFPIVSKEGTQYPFVVYRRNSVTPTYCKDGLASETASVDVVIASNTYTSSIEVADLVRAAIDKRACVFQDTTVTNIEMTTAEEDFVDDTYIQTLNFNFTI
ncbi:MAG: DUF3168 domain-containing protein [Oscillospiraceae bacterium]|nr:DUF3168 domain-containing protein [Oscillospiraceae bacterium]